MEVLAKLGVDWKLLIAQAVNFVVLLWVLRRFAYQPMLDFLEKRSAKIEQGLKDAEAAQRKLSEMEVKEKSVLSQAHIEARALITSAEVSAKKRDAERSLETEEKVKHLIAEAGQKIHEEKEKMLAEAKGELAETVILAVEKILREKVDAGKEKELIEKSLK